MIRSLHGPRKGRRSGHVLLPKKAGRKIRVFDDGLALLVLASVSRLFTHRHSGTEVRRETHSLSTLSVFSTATLLIPPFLCTSYKELESRTQLELLHVTYK